MTDQAKDNTIFPAGEQTTEVTQDNTTKQQSDPYADLLSSITAPDGRQKYDSTEAVLKAMPQAQQHISTLEEELRTLKEEREAMQNKLNSMTNVDQSLRNIAQRESEQTRPVGKELDEQAIAQLVELKLQEKERDAVIRNNQRAVADALSSKYGDKAEEMYKSRAQELGMDVATMNSIAGSHPKAVLEYFKATSPSVPKTTSSSVNTETLQGKPAEKLKNPLLLGGDAKAYWKDLADRLGANG